MRKALAEIDVLGERASLQGFIETHITDGVGAKTHQRACKGMHGERRALS